MTATVLSTAKVFTTGRSQAVRLPKAFRFNTSEVTIERQGDAVVLRPKLDDDDAWFARITHILSQFEGMPDEIERNKSEPVDDIESFD